MVRSCSMRSCEGKKIRWIVSDEGGPDGHSMARCTGLVTVFCIEEWISNPEMLTTGIHPPEEFGCRCN